ncbi:PhlD [Streptomyces sp. NPDC054796]
MSAYVTRPSVVLPAHKITTAEISDDIRDHHPHHPRLRVALRVVEGCGVTSRFFTRPLTEAVAAKGLLERIRTAFEDACAMAEDAARHALEAHGVEAHEVDAVITSHSTSWAVPNLDIQLIERLGLRPGVSRLAQTNLACAGGVQSLIRATDYVRSRPGAKVLVVVSEVLSAVYHRDEDSIESMIYKALFGDSAGACLVTDAPLGPGFAIEDTFEFVLPDSQDRYWGRLDTAGLHFDSSRKAVSAPADALPHLQEWLGTWRPEFAVVHPGGPRIIDDTARGIGLTPEDAHHSHTSLTENGNLGGNAVLDILRRTHQTPPPAGAEGLVVAFGPGFTVAAARGTWH